MCFSATSSFTVAVVSATAGAYCLTRAPDTRTRPMASMPLIFGAHQAVEGLVWLEITHSPHSMASGLPVFMFLAIATVFWPAFTPLAIRRAEPDERRRKWLNVFLVLGVGVAVFNAVKLASSAVHAEHLARSIRYSLEPNASSPLPDFLVSAKIAHLDWILAPYAVAAIGSLLVSSFAQIRWFGAFLTIALVVLFFVDRTHLLSVWCFLAAASSVLIALLMRDLHARRVAP